MAGIYIFSRCFLYKFCREALQAGCLWIIFRFQKRNAAKSRRYNPRQAFLAVSMSGLMPELSIKMLHSDIKNKSRRDSSAQRLNALQKAVFLQSVCRKADRMPAMNAFPINAACEKRSGLK